MRHAAVICRDAPGHIYHVADHEALEQCFQQGLLRCDGVDSNTCDQVAECDTYAKDWEACADPGKYLHCSGGSPGERGCKNTAETCAHGILARYKASPRRPRNAIDAMASP